MPQNTFFTNWGLSLQQPLIIAGPCSAETEEQITQTVDEIAALCPSVSMIRAGIWKPRTRPNSFEGVGAIGLPWLKNAAKKHNLPITVEVANAGHVDLALKNGVDVLWIGARSTVSPFIVQEIADSLKGVDIPVMVKNPINPDLELWIGAIERLQNVGLTKIAAIHRGFSTYEKTIFRNQPMWEIPIELRRRNPEIPIIVDPSHIGGKRNLIAPLAQQGLDMGFDGLMIETHYTPDKAWSDATQQITPATLQTILENLVCRQPFLEQPAADTLQELRAKIDRIDDYILELLGERMGVSEQIGTYKIANKLAFHQAKRWAAIVEKAKEKGIKAGLSEDFILKLFQTIHNESIFHQTKVLEKNQ